MISEYEENIVNWSEHLFNPRYLPPTRINEKNAAFGIMYGQGGRMIGELDRTTIIRTGRQTGRSIMSADAIALLRRIFNPQSIQPLAPAITPRQEVARRSFLQGRG